MRHMQNYINTDTKNAEVMGCRISIGTATVLWIKILNDWQQMTMNTEQSFNLDTT